MMKQETKPDIAHFASVNSYALSISTKQSVEIASFLRNKKVSQAKSLLNEVISMKRAVPFKRYNRDLGHKPGMAAGRYPIKASQEFLNLLNTLEANAEFKGLDSKNLIISTIKANKGTQQYKPGRHRGRTMKRTHITIIAKEIEEQKDDRKKIPKNKNT